MNAAAPQPDSPSPAMTTACRSIDESLGTLRGLLRLIDPESPFQPILLGSIDLVGWLALFGKAADRFGNAIGDIPDTSCRSAVLEASGPFLRLAYALTMHADVHCRPDEYGHLDEVPEIASFLHESAMRQEDADAIGNATDAASKAFHASSEDRNMLCRTLGLAADKLKKKLGSRSGLLRMMRRRCRDSRPFRSAYAAFIDTLEAALDRLPDPETTPWQNCRFSFAAVRYHLEADLLPDLRTLVRKLCATTPPTETSTNSLEKNTLAVITPFLEAHGLARSLDNAFPGLQYLTLFRGLLGPINQALAHGSSTLSEPVPLPRIIDDIQQFAPVLMNRQIRSSWEAALPETDAYAHEVVLAALDHLERLPEPGHSRVGNARRVFAFSASDLAGWVRSGNYKGASPHAEVSRTRAAENKRTERTLQHLRRVGAAFHDRRQWMPPHTHNAASTQHRMWTVNPLLVLLPRIAARLENGTPPVREGHQPSASAARPSPSRRNRGTRPRSGG